MKLRWTLEIGFIMTSDQVLSADLWSRNTVSWRSRRGLLELDMILMPFFERNYGLLSIQEKQMHQWVLLQKDVQLQKWLLYREDLDSLTASQRLYISKIWQFMDT